MLLFGWVPNLARLEGSVWGRISDWGQKTTESVTGCGMLA